MTWIRKNVELDGTAQTLVTIPGGVWELISVYVTGRDTANDFTFEMWVVERDGSAADSNRLAPALDIPQQDVARLPITQDAPIACFPEETIIVQGTGTVTGASAWVTLRSAE